MNDYVALAGFLTGVPLSQVPNALRGTTNASTVDNWPWIWKEYKQAGYTTMLVQDAPDIGAFQYRMLGFEKQPTDIYGRNFYRLAEEIIRNSEGHSKLCLNAEPKQMVYINYIREFLDVYKNDPKFLFGMLLEFSHEDNAGVCALFSLLYYNAKIQNFRKERQKDFKLLGKMTT